MKTHTSLRFLVAGFLLATTAQTVYSRQAKSPAPGKIGSFSVGQYGKAEIAYRKTGVAVILTGKNGGIVQANSNLYDIAAKRLDLATTSVGGKSKPTDMSATGSVKIVMRDPEAGRKTVVTCDKAVFVASNNPADRGTLRLTGDVVQDTWDKSAAVPYHSESETGRIIFLPNNELNVILENGVFKGQPNEPPAKPKGKQP